MSSVRAGGRTVEVTHPDKVLFPDDGITKAELVEYYRVIASWMLPYLKERPVNLERFPAGIGRPGFFQQGMSDYFPDWIESVTVAKAGGAVKHAVLGSAAALVYVANQGCITPHAWLSRRDKLDHPDQLIFDLDPPAARLDSVGAATAAVGELLRELGLASFVKTTGSRGYHVTVPLDRKLEYDAVRAFAHDVSAIMVARQPKLLTTETRKEARRGRIFLDTLRNAYAHTAVPPFAVRARKGAPVATPITWDELGERGMRSDRFTIRNLAARLERTADPWDGFRRSARSLGAARRKLDKLLEDIR